MADTPKLNAALVKASQSVTYLELDGDFDTGEDRGRRRIQFDYLTAEGVLEVELGRARDRQIRGRGSYKV